MVFPQNLLFNDVVFASSQSAARDGAAGTPPPISSKGQNHH